MTTKKIPTFSFRELKELGFKIPDIATIRRRAKIRLAQLEQIRAVNFRTYQNFVKIRRVEKTIGGVTYRDWQDPKSDRIHFKAMQRNLNNLQDSINTVRAAAGLKPKKHSMNPYPEEN